MNSEQTVLIVEDSQVVALYLQAILEAEPGLRVIGRAADGEEAVRLIDVLRPDVVTMDICMPLMDGFEATRAIMEQRPTPIVVVSSLVDNEEMRSTFRALEAGAVAVVRKPPGADDPRFEAIRRELVGTVCAMAGLRVVARRSSPSPGTDGEVVLEPPREAPSVIAIGTSTGGPQALQTLLGGLPAELPVPVVVVQHICEGFLGGLVSWLQDTCRVRIRAGGHGERLLPGQVYFAPDDCHVLLRNLGAELRIELDVGPPISSCRPSATRLFESCASECPGTSIGVVLTGMGDDGAQGLLSMRRRGCLTLVQDEASAVVYGMPGAARQLGAVERVVALHEMSGQLLGAVGASPAAKPSAPLSLKRGISA